MGNSPIHTCFLKPTNMTICKDTSPDANWWYVYWDMGVLRDLVLTDIFYCPYCGDRLTTTADTHIKE